MGKSVPLAGNAHAEQKVGGDVRARARGLGVRGDDHIPILELIGCKVWTRGSNSTPAVAGVLDQDAPGIEGGTNTASDFGTDHARTRRGVVGNS
jgi:hypothetical protein